MKKIYIVKEYDTLTERAYILNVLDNLELAKQYVDTYAKKFKERAKEFKPYSDHPYDSFEMIHRNNEFYCVECELTYEFDPEPKPQTEYEVYSIKPFKDEVEFLIRIQRENIDGKN